MFSLIKSDIYRIIKGNLGIISLLGITTLAIFIGVMSGKGDSVEALTGGLSIGTMVLPIFFTNIFMITFGNDYSYRVVNNSLISGIKRSTYYFSKVILTFLLATVYVFIFSLVLVVTLKVTTGELMVVEAAKIFIAQLPLYLGASAIGIVCFNFIKTPYIAVAAFISLAFVGDNFISIIVSNFVPKLEGVLDTLIFTNLGQLVGVNAISTQSLMTIIVSCVIYSVCLIFIGYRSVKTREFK